MESDQAKVNKMYTLKKKSMNLFKKVLYVDVETTGLEAGKHGIIQLAALMEIGGEVVDSFEMKFQPHNGAEIDLEALKVNGTDPVELKSRTTSSDAYREFVRFLDKHISKFDRADKAYPAGYNVPFDLEFLEFWFRHHGSKYGTGSYHNWKALDPLPVLRIWDYKGLLALPDYKLATVCEYFGIHHRAHDALSDITATRVMLTDLLGD